VATVNQRRQYCPLELMLVKKVGMFGCQLHGVPKKGIMPHYPGHTCSI